jgi:hypothetical protein
MLGAGPGMRDRRIAAMVHPPGLLSPMPGGELPVYEAWVLTTSISFIRLACCPAQQWPAGVPDDPAVRPGHRPGSLHRGGIR